MDASCLYQCFRGRCNIMGDFLAHFSVPAEHCCLRVVADRVPLWLQFAIVDASSRKTHHSSHHLRPVSWSWRWSLHPNSLHSQGNERFKSWMLVWWCHDDVAWPQSVRNVWAPCCCWVMRIKAALKAKQVQPRANKVYLMKWPESISHNFPSSSSHRVVSACKNDEILQNKQLEHKSASVSQECAVILFTITWKLCIYHTCWSCSGGLNSFTETDVSQPVAFIEVWSLPKNTKWNGGVLLSSADFLLCSVDVGQTVSEERKD